MATKTSPWRASFDGENRGTAWVLGDDVSTDDIILGKFLEIRDASSLSAHVLERFGIDFAKRVRPGDVIIAGKNFGSGSSREQAPFLLQFLGIGAIFATSFARIFYRNAINIGLPAIVVGRDVHDAFDQGVPVTYTLVPPAIANVATGKEFPLQPMPAFFLDILRAGGAIPLLKKTLMGE
ncbi:MAG: 3-isopropylmalate dehydratase [Candidatus Lokiarchaeota archaeon]|nr:3-isopropylmalate dehydratase [Candidatus Lokiarchaeota archaeon]